jgi:microcystin-dependent protein
MNRSKFNQGQGIARQTMIHMQEAIQAAFVSILSNFTSDSAAFFVSGCIVSTNTVGNDVTVNISAGHAVLNGEPFAVPADQIVRNVGEVAWLAIQETFLDATAVINQEAVASPNQVQRILVLKKGSNFPAPGTYVPLNAPTQLQLLEAKLSSRLMRVGSIFIWQGTLDNFNNTGLGLANTAAAGLAICNGNNGTPDMRGLAAIGAINTGKNTGAPSLPVGVVSNYAVGDVVGVESVQLEVNQIPQHNHSYTDTRPVFVAGASPLQNGTGHVNTPNNTTTGNTGGGDAHENRQPSMAVLWVMVVS